MGREEKPICEDCEEMSELKIALTQVLKDHEWNGCDVIVFLQKGRCHTRLIPKCDHSMNIIKYGLVMLTEELGNRLFTRSQVQPTKEEVKQSVEEYLEQLNSPEGHG